VFVAGPLLAQNLEIKNSVPGSLCNTRGEFEWLWGNPNFTKIQALCLLEGLALGGFDAEEGLSVPKEHIEVRVRGSLNGTGFGGFGSFFGRGLVEGEAGHLVPMLRAHGYVEDESVFEVRYDWRLSVNDWKLDVFPLTQQRIENAVRKFGGQRAVLTGLSMAGPFLHSFLSWVGSQDPTWTSRHVHAFAPVGGPWNGAVMALSAVLGSALQTFSSEGLCPRCNPPRKSKDMPDPASRSIIDQFLAWLSSVTRGMVDEVLGQVVHTMPSMYYMSTGLDYSRDPPVDRNVLALEAGWSPLACHSPTSAACGAESTRDGTRFDDKGFLNTSQCAECYQSGSTSACFPGFDLASQGFNKSLCCRRLNCKMRTLKASEIPELLHNIGRHNEGAMMKFALQVVTTTDPGVPVHCILSHNVQTFSYLYSNTSADLDQESIVLDDGDQTVDALSLEVCTRWPSTVKTYRVPGVRHGSMYDIKQVNDIIVALATNDTDAWSAWMEPKISELIYTSNKSVAPPEELLLADPQGGVVELLV